MQAAVKSPQLFRRIWLQAGFLKFLSDEVINRIRRPTFTRFGQLGLLHLSKRPMRLILGALFDPALDHRDFSRIHRLVTLRGRHDGIRILFVHPLDEHRFFRISLDDHRQPVIPQNEGVFHPVQAQRSFLGLPRPGVRAMAMITILRENRLDVLIERHLFRKRILLDRLLLRRGSLRRRRLARTEQASENQSSCKKFD